MRNKLMLPGVEAAFFQAVARSGGNVSYGARAAAVTLHQVNARRKRDPKFNARLVGLLPDGKPVRVMHQWDAATRAAFLDALAETGVAARAAQQVGVDEMTGFALRRRDSEFAFEWAQALIAAGMRIEDRLFEGALEGFVSRRVAADGTVTVTYRQRPEIMLKLLERRDVAAKTKYRTIELTPELVEGAQARIERYVQQEAEARVAHAAETGSLAEGDATP